MTTTNLKKHSWDPDRDGWEWSLANPMEDSKDITDLANDHFRDGMEGMMTINYPRMLECVTMSATQQIFDRSVEWLGVCRSIKDSSLLAYAWFDRGGFTPYSLDEISNQRFIHIRKDLPVASKVKMTYQALHQHLGWAAVHGIPVVCSTSILGDHKGFMRIHEDLGYTVRGSYAYRRTTA